MLTEALKKKQGHSIANSLARKPYLGTKLGGQLADPRTLRRWLEHLAKMVSDKYAHHPPLLECLACSKNRHAQEWMTPNK